jgi:undecaprenyl-diphosphatase
MKRGVIIGLAIAIVAGIIGFAYDSAIAELFKSMQNAFLSNILFIFRPVIAMIILGLLFVVFLIMEKKRRWALPLALSFISSVIISFAIKFIIMRPRPFGFTETIALTNLPDYSFPSSHVVFIFSALPILSREFPRLKYIWVALAVLVGVSRIYFTDHYLSDVIFGAIIGYLIGLYFLWLEDKFNWGEKLVKRFSKK